MQLDATPPEENQNIQPEPEPQPKPKPQVLQPPQPPDEPADMAPDTVADEGEKEAEEIADTSWTVWVWVGGSILAAIQVLLRPFIIVGAVKAARRKRRIEAERESDRLAGGWHEVVDQAVDLGLAVPAG